ncbi:MAG: S8 family serine peptidase [Flavobacteriaceae bacterium]|nr:S8 family serine peptidase [Flavobacteriaceae bacterium]
MSPRLRFFLIVFLYLIPTFGFTQEDCWFYLRAKSESFNPAFETSAEGNLKYVGGDVKLKNVLDTYEIYQFKKTQRNTNNETRHKTFFVRANDEALLLDLLLRTNHVFYEGEVLSAEDKKIFEPNDYGLTSTIGENLGFQVNLDYLDFLGLPKAWYYTTGNRDFIVGISDGIIDTTSQDFKGKSKIITKSNLANGHGYSISSIAAAQGDNAYGVPGVCYDCSVYSTNYGDFNKFGMLKELSDMGVKVINCSWSAAIYKESAEKVVDEMFDNGTILVATSGNKDHRKTKGKIITYPASYDHVISVSSGMYKYEKPWDNMGIDKNGNYGATNIRGYVGRSLGFKNNDTLVEPHVWPISIATLNKDVDILAPTAGVFLYSHSRLKDTLVSNRFETTSSAAPLVTGTIALMYSLNPCLPHDEVESIIKMTAMNVDHLEGNKPYKGLYGAGMLQTGDAVEMVYKLYMPKETAYIEDQQFDRWDFKLTALSDKVVMQNQKFTDSSTLKLTARRQIVLKPGTILRPNSGGKISMKIDDDLEKECDLVLRDPSIVND